MSCRTFRASKSDGDATYCHCPYCHGYEVRDQPLGVLGGTPDAVHHALLIRQWSPDVTLFPHTNTTLTADERERLTAHGIRIADGTVARLVVDEDRLQGVELVDGTVVPRTAVFVRPRLMPNSDLLTSLGCEVDENGWAVHDSAGRTTVAGAWVIGNAADPRAQVITAAGQGSAAAIALNADLVDEDVNRSLAESRSSLSTSLPQIPNSTHLTSLTSMSDHESRCHSPSSAAFSYLLDAQGSSHVDIGPAPGAAAAPATVTINVSTNNSGLPQKSVSHGWLVARSNAAIRRRRTRHGVSGVPRGQRRLSTRGLPR